MKELGHKDRAAAVLEVIAGDDDEAVAARWDVPVAELRIARDRFTAAGRDAVEVLADAASPNPSLDTIRRTAQLAFPTHLFHGVRSAVSFFCAQFHGKNDVVHLYHMGLDDVTLVDIDSAKLAHMAAIYPPTWRAVEQDAFAFAHEQRAANQSWDLVVCDPYSSLAPEVVTTHVAGFVGISSDWVVLLFSQAILDTHGLGANNHDAIADFVSDHAGTPVECVEVVRRSGHAGGIYWVVLRRTGLAG